MGDVPEQAMQRGSQPRPHLVFRTSFLKRLKKRHLVRAGLLYLLVCRILLELINVAARLLDLPGWTGKVALVLMGLGLPATLVFAWVFEKPMEHANAAVNDRLTRRLNIAILAALAGLLLYLAVDRFLPTALPVAKSSPVTARAAAPMPWSPSDPRMRFGVLPFDAQKDDRTASDQAEAISAQIVDGLANGRFSSSVVLLPREERNSTVDVIGRRFKIEFLINGSIYRQDDRLVGSGNLIEVATGNVVGSPSFAFVGNGSDRDNRREFLAVIGDIHDRAWQAEIARVKSLSDQQRDVRDLETLSWAYFQSQKDAIDKMVALRERAFSIAPGDIHVQALMGLALSLRAANSWSDDKASDLRRSKELALQVLRQDPRNVDALRSQSLIAGAEGRYQDQIAFEDMILEITPNASASLGNKAGALITLGRPKEAVTILDSYSESPFNQDKDWSASLYCRAFLYAGRYSESRDRCQASVAKNIAMGDNTYHAARDIVSLVVADALSGDRSRSILEAERLRSGFPSLQSIGQIVDALYPGAQRAYLDLITSGLRQAGFPD